MSSSLERFRSLLGRLENSRAKSRRGSEGKRRNPPAVKNPIEGRPMSPDDPGNRNFNRGYRPGLVPGSMRRGPNVRDIDLIGRPDRQVPGVRYDRIGDMRIPEKGEFFGWPRGGLDVYPGRPEIYGPNKRPGFTQPGGGHDFSGLDRPISSVKEKPGGGRKIKMVIPEDAMYEQWAKEKGSDRPISSVKEKPGGGRNNDAKPSAGRGKGKDFEKMLRARMSGF